ncbi:MAG: methyltransferase domain-containing protein [Ruminococcaceae bacterium]|nr:methyltransferase domain-containing protein [Oscillospiraceae bacterium]
MPDLTLELHPHILSDMLICPVCGSNLHISENHQSLVCGGIKQHCFDGGGGGYLPLAPRHSGGGDSKEAVRYRTAFLSAGYYRPAAEALCVLVKKYVPESGKIIDAGCGEGYYSNLIADSGYCVAGFDLSKFAVDAAAKAAKRIRSERPSQTVYAVGSVFELPLRNECADGVINIFAPCAPEEYARVLKDDGILIVAGAGEDHLMGLKKVIYDDPYLNEGRRDLPEEGVFFHLLDKLTVSFDITITDPDHMEALFSMTPYYWRTSRGDHEKLRSCPELSTPVTFDFFVYQKI